MIEYLERLGSDGASEHWLVRHDGQLANVHVYTDEDPSWSTEVVKRSRVWLEVRHPSLIPLIAIEATDKLVAITGDERGPMLVRIAEKLEPEERERWVASEIAGVAEAIATMASRERGFVHRRVDPGNILVGDDGHARLRAPIAYVAAGPRAGYLGQGRSVHGTATYSLSPEQVVGNTTSPATDVFQLAANLCWALSGKNPFRRDDDFQTLSAIKNAEAARPPTTIPGLADFVLANLARDPAARLPDPGTFAVKLRALVPEPPAAIYAKVAALRGNQHVPANRSVGIRGYRCPKSWNDLTATRAPGVRHCATCDHDVVQVRSIDALVPLLGKSCIAYSEED